MKILYGFSNCTDKKYNEIFADKQVMVLQADQKYHGLLIKGLKANNNEIYCLSGLPINRSVTKKLFICEKDETENGVKYHYIKTVNLPLLRQLGIYCGSYRFVKKESKKDNNAVVLCDFLNIANAFGMAKGAKRKKLPIVFIVTDLPEFQREGLLKKLNDKLFKKADGFVFLTEQMNERVNVNKMPYIVLEGHTDGTLAEIPDSEKYEFTSGKKIIIYAGSIKRLYGIQNLVEGFIKADIKDAELHVYGDGDYREELEIICAQNPAVKYMGIKQNSDIVYEEQRAALLVNPRPTKDEYTKYSFPSKNMEYMVSGTPVLTTKLPAMPKEYYPFVFKVEDESADGICTAIKEIFDKDKVIRYGMGRAAREFVLKNKSSVVQAKKLSDFLSDLVKEK